MKAELFAKKFRLRQMGECCMSCLHAFHVNEGVYECIHPFVSGSLYVKASGLCDMFAPSEVTVEDKEKVK